MQPVHCWTGQTALQCCGAASCSRACKMQAQWQQAHSGPLQRRQRPSEYDWLSKQPVQGCRSLTCRQYSKLSAADVDPQVCKSSLLREHWEEAACEQLAKSISKPSPKRRKIECGEQWLAAGQSVSALAARTTEQLAPAGGPHAEAAPAVMHAPPWAAGLVSVWSHPPSYPSQRKWPVGLPMIAAKGAPGSDVVSICCRFGTYDTPVLAAFSFATSTAEFAARTGIATGDARRRQPMVRSATHDCMSPICKLTWHPFACGGGVFACL